MTANTVLRMAVGNGIVGIRLPSCLEVAPWTTAGAKVEVVVVVIVDTCKIVIKTEAETSRY